MRPTPSPAAIAAHARAPPSSCFAIAGPSTKIADRTASWNTPKFEMLTQSHLLERTSPQPSRSSSRNGRTTLTAPWIGRPASRTALTANVAASRAIAHPVPTVATSAPPTIGPATLATLTEKKRRAFASCRLERSTVCGVSPPAAGW